MTRGHPCTLCVFQLNFGLRPNSCTCFYGTNKLCEFVVYGRQPQITISIYFSHTSKYQPCLSLLLRWPALLRGQLTLVSYCSYLFFNSIIFIKDTVDKLSVKVHLFCEKMERNSKMLNLKFRLCIIFNFY